MVSLAVSDGLVACSVGTVVETTFLSSVVVEDVSAFLVSVLAPFFLLSGCLASPLTSGLGAGSLESAPLLSDGVTIFPKQ